jgi:hypothetical protein
MNLGRYRIQSDSTEFLFLVFDDLIRRIVKKQPDARLNCPVPLHLFVTAIGEHVEVRVVNLRIMLRKTLMKSLITKTLIFIA